MKYVDFNCMQTIMAIFLCLFVFSSSMDSGLFGGGGGGGLFGGLGGKPDAAKANTNVFGVSFGETQQPTGDYLFTDNKFLWKIVQR